MGRRLGLGMVENSMAYGAYAQFIWDHEPVRPLLVSMGRAFSQNVPKMMDKWRSAVQQQSLTRIAKKIARFDLHPRSIWVTAV